MKKNLIFIFVSVLIILSCAKKTAVESFEQRGQNVNAGSKSRAELDAEILDKYLSENKIEAISHPSGLRYFIHKEGTGSQPQITDTINVDYIGSLLDGSSFDAAKGVAFPLARLIRGWQIGFPLLKEGAEATFYIPSELAYGSMSPSPSIPANSNLIFVVKLNSIVK